MSEIEATVDTISRAARSDRRSDLALSQATGLSAGTIKSIRSGGYRPATIKNLIAVERALGLAAANDGDSTTDGEGRGGQGGRHHAHPGVHAVRGDELGTRVDRDQLQERKDQNPELGLS